MVGNVPDNLGSLDAFRRWALSDDFPQRGRIDFVAGRIEVDMSPEDLFAHGTLKVALCATLHELVRRGRRGHLFADRTRLSSPTADLSVEPDVVFVSYAALDAARVRLVPKATGEPGRFVELEGAPDMVAEIVSDSSVGQDTRELPAAYFAAGIREFWLIDARGENVVFQVHRAGETGWIETAPDDEGWTPSVVFDARFRLERTADRHGHWQYQLHAAPPARD